MSEYLSNIGPKHLLGVFAVGVVAGLLIVVLDNAAIQRVEAAAGIVPSAA